MYTGQRETAGIGLRRLDFREIGLIEIAGDKMQC